MLRAVCSEHLFWRDVQTRDVYDWYKGELKCTVMQVSVHFTAFHVVEMEGSRLITLACHDKINNGFLEQGNDA